MPIMTAQKEQIRNAARVHRSHGDSRIDVAGPGMPERPLRAKDRIAPS